VTYPRTGSDLTFEKISKKYGAVTALQPIQLSIAAGEFFALLGPSGSGKTTLLGIAAGFVAPTAGRVLVKGTDISRVPPERRNIGMVFQNYSLFPFLTVARNVAFPLEMRRLSKPEIAERVERMLAMVRLSHLADRLPSQLSGGQQQRVALARAAVYDPSVLLMDEPLGALDKNLREEMQEEIKSFHAKIGATIIYVTHDQHEAAAMADRTAIMNHGTLVQCGPQRTLYENPCNAFVASFLGEANLLDVVGATPCPGGYRIRTWDGSELLASAGDDEPKDVVCIRPENIVVSRTAVDCRNRLEGTVADVVHAGLNVRYRIRINDSLSLVARVPSRRDREKMERGDRVVVGFDPEDTQIIPR
jgi:putative spermidine/putrescine transport system ATP-binding protein